MPISMPSCKEDTTPLGKARLQYFWINKGPWSVLDGFKAFLPGVPRGEAQGRELLSGRHDQRGVRDLGRDLCPRKSRSRPRAFSPSFAGKTPADQHPGNLRRFPYSEEYKDDLTRAASLLKEAAEPDRQSNPEEFLNLRADAFLSNDYYASDLAWMDLDAPIDITIGPYETYNDELFGYKAAFEVYVNLRDDEETAKLSAFSAHLQEIEDNLPIDPQYRKPETGSSRADSRRGRDSLRRGWQLAESHTAAYNLPNDERVVQQKGSKRVMLKNVQEAKFRSVLLPIARRMLSPVSPGGCEFRIVLYSHRGP